MQTYADVCRRMLTYADVCGRIPTDAATSAWNFSEYRASMRELGSNLRHLRTQRPTLKVLAYAYVCKRMLTYATSATSAHRGQLSRYWRMLTYASVC
jgi:hypothetical protein